MTGKAQCRQTEKAPDANTGEQSLNEASENEAVPGILETAAYIHDVAGDLRDLAHAAQMPLLAYLLDMARLEAKARLK